MGPYLRVGCLTEFWRLGEAQLEGESRPEFWLSECWGRAQFEGEDLTEFRSSFALPLQPKLEGAAWWSRGARALCPA